MPIKDALHYSEQNIEKQAIYLCLSIPTPGFPPFLLYLWCKLGVTFARSCTRDVITQSGMTYWYTITLSELSNVYNIDERLYWTDAEEGQQRIERCNFTGHHREVVLEVPGIHLMDILIDGGYFYYSGWNSS